MFNFNCSKGLIITQVSSGLPNFVIVCERYSSATAMLNHHHTNRYLLPSLLLSFPPSFPLLSLSSLISSPLSFLPPFLSSFFPPSFPLLSLSSLLSSPLSYGCLTL